MVSFPVGGARGQMTASDDEFVEFANAASARLRRTAFQLCGNWHTAEDLAQTTLAKMYASWRRIRSRDALYAYALRTLLNTYLAQAGKKNPREVLTGKLPDQSVEPHAPELRMAVNDAVARLPPKARAVVVLRYWEDMSVEETAAALGCSTGNVKSQCARALDKLRPLVGDALSDVDHSDAARLHRNDRRKARNERDVPTRTA